jgi:hypothetical protein
MALEARCLEDPAGPCKDFAMRRFNLALSLRRLGLTAAASLLLIPGAASASLIGSDFCTNFADPNPCNTAENVASLILGVEAPDLTFLVAAEGVPLPAGLAFFDPSNAPIADPFGSDLNEGYLTWSGSFDYLSVKAAGTLYVYDSGRFDLLNGVSNIKLWGTGGTIVPEPTGALIFAIGFAVMEASRRRRV